MTETPEYDVATLRLIYADLTQKRNRLHDLVKVEYGRLIALPAGAGIASIFASQLAHDGETRLLTPWSLEPFHSLS